MLITNVSLTRRHPDVGLEHHLPVVRRVQPHRVVVPEAGGDHLAGAVDVDKGPDAVARLGEERDGLEDHGGHGHGLSCQRHRGPWNGLTLIKFIR